MKVEPETRSLLAVRVEHMRDFLEAEVVGIDLEMAREVGFKVSGEIEASMSVLWESGIFSVA